MQLIPAPKPRFFSDVLERILNSPHADKVIENAMTHGNSVEEYCAELGISKRLHERYLKVNTRYAELFSFASTRSIAWWNRLLKAAVFGKIKVDNKLLLARMNLLALAQESNLEKEAPLLPAIEVHFIDAKVEDDGAS